MIFQRKMKPCVFTFILFSIAPIMTLVIFIMSSIQIGRIDLSFLSVFIAVTFLSYAWLLKTAIEIKDNTLIVTGLFRTDLISIPTISEITINIIASDKSKFEMIISHSSVGQRNPIKINIKLFSKKDLQFLANYLTEKNNNAKYDTRFLNMKVGKMPSLFN